MKRYIQCQVTTQVGSILKTYKGSLIKRSKYGVGKLIGGDLYFHKQYAAEVVPPDILESAEAALADAYPDFQYNCMRLGKDDSLSFQEAPDFDIAREPIVGDYVTVFPDGRIATGHSNYIWHHKWLWVKNDYTGFDVAEAWEWSKQWLSLLEEKSDGNALERGMSGM